MGAESGLIGMPTVTGAMPTRKRLVVRIIVVIGGAPDRLATA